MNTKRRPDCAFTLLDLLASLAILTVLGVIVLPALARTEPNSQAVQCLANLKRLIGGWQMYASDNQDRLVYNTDGVNTGKPTGGFYGSGWVGGWLDLSVAGSDNTNMNWLVNHDLSPGGTYACCGFLGPYVKDPRLWKCPADKAQVPLVPVDRVRSYSMNNLVGALSRTWTGGHANPGVTLAGRQGGSSHPLFEKGQQMRSPAQVFVMLDELPEGINDGDFFTDPDVQYQLVDCPSNRHNGAAGFSFADGHAEIHKWLDVRTLPLIPPGGILNLNVNFPGDVDVTWLQQHATGFQ